MIGGDILKWNVEFYKISFSYIGALFVWLFGAYDPLIKLLIVIVIADVLSGLLGAISNKNLDSDKMYRGGLRKISIFLVIAVSVQIDIVFNNSLPLREMAIIYYVTTEGLSFSENISKFITLPKGFTKFFENLKDEGNGKK